jgi:hypothetical protein
MLRVSKRHLCPICGKSDWCLYSEDDSAAICARIGEGSVKQCGDAGWLHTLKNRHNGHYRHRQAARKRQLVKTTVIQQSKLVDFEQLTELYRQQITEDRLESLSQQLGVSIHSLKRLHTGWDGRAYTFPMRDENMKIIGIRRRFGDGNKKALAGSRNGLFVPTGLSKDKPLFITEGPTDCATALDLDFDSVGRPNCNSRIDMVVRFVKERNAVIIADNDSAGVKGAEKLARKLVLHSPCVRIVCPPAGIKDLRQWLKTGLSASKLKTVIANTEPIGIRIKPMDHNREAR